MATLGGLVTTIASIIQDSTETEIRSRINEAVSTIAGGIRLPTGQTTPPLPELYSMDTVTTATDAAYVSLPVTYQRNVFMIVDDSGDTIKPVPGGSYYDFNLFLKHLSNKDLSESGSIYRVAVKGRNLYYQGIPSVAKVLTVHSYRKPVEMTASGHEPDGIPEQLQVRLIKHYVCAHFYGDGIEDGKDSLKMGYNHHMAMFYEAAIDLINHIGIDEVPVFYASGESSFVDTGALY